MTTSAATKIVIASGQEFSVPADTDNEAIRKQLAGMGFADVASATIQTGKRLVEGQDVQTIEFVKKAGTKGLDGAGLVDLLNSIPQTRVTRAGYPSRSERDLLQQLVSYRLTVEQVLADDGHTIDAALRGCSEYHPSGSEGARLCDPCDQLPAVAVSTPFAW
jgi:hypothetical protein